MDSHREMDTLVYRMVRFIGKVPVSAWREKAKTEQTGAEAVQKPVHES